jgi:two-component sensor histidine kinase
VRHRNRASWPLPTRLGVGRALALGLICSAASIGFRAALTPFLAGEERFIAMFPALLVAGFYGGAIGGLSCLLLTIIGVWYFFVGRPMSFAFAPHEAAGLCTLLISGGMVVAGAIAARRLVQDLEEAREAERLLALELQHRVRNNLAVVEALATQSARDAEGLDLFLERFLGRLRSLSTAHVLLSREAGEVVGLGALVESVLAPFSSGGRISWSGEPIRLRAREAQTLSLCLHELATNAVKYGALSGETGTVSVSWSMRSGDLVCLRWVERGGPRVLAPARSGSGAALLRRGVAPSRPARVVYGEDGLTWSAEFPVADGL